MTASGQLSLASEYGLRLPAFVSCACTHKSLATAPTTAPCIRHWRRSLSLQAIPSPALLPAAAGSHPSGHLLRKLPADPQHIAVTARFQLAVFFQRMLRRALLSAGRRTRSFIMAEERIQKIVAEQGLCSRRAAERIIAEGPRQGQRTPRQGGRQDGPQPGCAACG